jgi:hypothetical protein
MKLKVVLTVSAIYLAVLGVGFMFAPREIGVDAVPADASPALIAYLRIFGGPFLGIAVLNWMARNAEPSAARNAIVIANIVGFGCVTSMDVWGVRWRRTPGSETVPCDSSADDCRLRRGRARSHASPTTLGSFVGRLGRRGESSNQRPNTRLERSTAMRRRGVSEQKVLGPLLSQICRGAQLQMRNRS